MDAWLVTPVCVVSRDTPLCKEELFSTKPLSLAGVSDVPWERTTRPLSTHPRTSSTRTAIMAAAPVETVQSIRMTWSSLMSLGSRR